MQAEESSSSHRLYTIVGCSTALIWGVSVMWVRVLSEALGAFRACALAHTFTGIAGCIMWLFLGAIPIWRRAAISRWFYIRLFFFCANVICFYCAISLVQRSELPLVILINYLWPTLTMVLSAWILRIPIYRKGVFLAGNAVVLASISFELLRDSAVSIHGAQTIDGVALFLALCGAVSWAMYSVVSRGWGSQSGGPSAAPLCSLITAAVAYFVSGFFPHVDPHWSSEAGIWLVVCVVANVAGYLCWDIGMRKGSVVTISLAADTMPWISLLGVFVFKGVPIRSDTIVSAIVLVFGAIITRFGTMPKYKVIKV